LFFSWRRKGTTLELRVERGRRRRRKKKRREKKRNEEKNREKSTPSIPRSPLCPLSLLSSRSHCRGEGNCEEDFVD